MISRADIRRTMSTIESLPPCAPGRCRIQICVVVRTIPTLRGRYSRAGTGNLEQCWAGLSPVLRNSTCAADLPRSGPERLHEEQNQRNEQDVDHERLDQHE